MPVKNNERESISVKNNERKNWPKRNEDCDLEIQFGRKTFSVHKSLLVSQSKYFKEKLSSEKECVGRAVLDIKDDFDEIGLSWCIEYMYNDKYAEEHFTLAKELDVELMKRVLEVSAALCMKGHIKKLCMGQIHQNIKANNCLDAVELCRTYGEQNDVEVAQNHVKKYFSDIVESEKFLQVSKDDLFKYIEQTEAKSTIKWQAITRWIKYDASDRRICFPALLSIYLGTDGITLHELIRFVLPYSEVKADRHCLDLVLNKISKQFQRLENELNVETSLLVLRLAKMDEYNDNKKQEYKKKTIEFLAENLVMLYNSKMLHDLNSEDLKEIISSKHIKCGVEYCWKVIIDWIKTEEESHKKDLFNLMKELKIEKMSSNFIINTIRREPLVRDCNDCLLYIFDEMSYRVYKSEEATTETLAIMDSGKAELIFVDVLSRAQFKSEAPIKTAALSYVASIDRSLFLLQDDSLMRLTRDCKWEEVTKLNEFSWIQLVAFEKKLWIIMSQSITVYNPEDGVFVHRGQACSLGAGFSSTCSKDHIFAVGGKDSGDNAKKFTLAKEWQQLQKMPFSVSQPATAFFDKKLYVMGSTYLGIINSSSVACFSKNEWTMLSDMRSRRPVLAAIVCQDRLFVIGGQGRLTKNKIQNNIEEYEEEADQWIRFGKIERTAGKVSVCVCHLSAMDKEKLAQPSTNQ